MLSFPVLDFTVQLCCSITYEHTHVVCKKGVFVPIEYAGKQMQFWYKLGAQFVVSW